MDKDSFKLLIIALLFCFSNYVYSQDKKPEGKFLLKGSDCAGFTFTDDQYVLWTNEFFCNAPDTLQIRWMEKKTFITKSFKQDKDCPPHIGIYQIQLFNEKTLILKEMWTGWGNFRDQTLEFIKHP